MLASGLVAAGELTRRAVFAQPDWLRGVPGRVGGRRFPEARVLFTGCGTSYHAARAGAALAGGEAEQALELVLERPHADLLVAVSHNGTTPLTLEAARAFDGPVWLVTGPAESPLASLADEVVVAAPESEESMCHTASYTAAVAAMAALAGEDVSGLPAAVADALARRLEPFDHDRVLVAGAGADWATAEEAALKLREGVFLPAEAHETEQLLHGHLAAVDEGVRAFVLAGRGRAAERAHDAVAALRTLGAETTLVPTTHPVVDIVPFQLLVLELAERRGTNPDLIRRDDDRWRRARAAYA